MKLRVGRVIAGAMACAAVTLVVSAGNASAEETPGISWDHVFSAEGVRVYVEEHGDIISVCDTKANGHSAVVQVRATDVWPYNYEMRVTAGNGSCKTHRASDGATYNLTEGREVDLWFDGNGGTFDGSAGFTNDH
ncbi:hypothetical protein [Streptomyces sp. NPDC000229]|uniref:hypothetical protein n=1 Tax=Streptomyces sp. NPDC000229 TaxID=3154247 RepID=UPI00332E2C44